jgi:hypothetical protein
MTAKHNTVEEYRSDENWVKDATLDGYVGQNVTVSRKYTGNIYWLFSRLGRTPSGQLPCVSLETTDLAAATAIAKRVDPLIPVVVDEVNELAGRPFLKACLEILKVQDEALKRFDWIMDFTREQRRKFV